jgi:hypothetical protein
MPASSGGDEKNKAGPDFSGPARAEFIADRG